MEFFKYILSKVIKNILIIYYIFPINNKKIVFYPANGKYYCNLKYIYMYLREKKQKNLKMIWIVDNFKETSYSKEIIMCKKNSLIMFYHLLTAKIVLFNNMLFSYLPKRNGQVYLETWHGGGAYKKLPKVFNHDNFFREGRFRHVYDGIDYVISACFAFDKAFSCDSSINYAKYLHIGMPRNDLFFSKKKLNINKKVRDYYHIMEDNIVCLYAPTIRHFGTHTDKLDYQSLIDSLKKEYGKEVFLLVRAHPHKANNLTTRHTDNVINVHEYPDMQELLCAADILITDYSSCMWDFSLTFKPCFIFATDIQEYKEEHDFHTPMSEWPFPIATNNKELMNNITNFDEAEYIEKVKQHHKALGSYEDGHATERVCKLIEKICSGEK